MSNSRISLVLSDGTKLTQFRSYRIRQDIRSLGSSFILETAPISDEIKDKIEILKKDPSIKIEVDNTSLIIGRIGEFVIQEDRDGGSVCVLTGEDLLGVAAKSSLPRGFSVKSGTIKSAVEDALSRYGLSVISTNDNNRNLITTSRRRVRARSTDAETLSLANLPSGTRVTLGGYYYTINEHGSLDEVTTETDVADSDDRQLLPMPGDKIGSWIEKICEHNKLLCWLSADGNVILTRPRYNQINCPSIIVGGEAPVEGSVQSAEWIYRPIDMSLLIEVSGRIGRNAESKFTSYITNDDLSEQGWKTYTLEVDDSLKNQTKADDMVERMYHDEWLKGWQWKCTLSGHTTIDGILPAPDVVFNIKHPNANINEKLYCIARDFSKSRTRGIVCDLTFVKLNLL